VQRRPRRFDRNLVVIGAGSAGLIAALTAAKLQASVTLVEAGAMGGDCLNTGCVPSKALLHAARLAATAREAAALGLMPATAAIDSAAALRHVRAAIAAVAPHDSAERYRGLGVDVRQGQARIISPWSVAVGGVTLSTRAIVIATGAAPAVPAIPGLDRTGFFTSETIWTLTEAPRRLLILGGGPVGCELAQAFARLGSAVTIAQRGPRLLPREDDEVGDLVRARLAREGAQILLGHRADAASAGSVRFTHDAGERAESFDALLIATGRRPRTQGFGLEALGIPLAQAGTIATNAWMQTLHRNIYACGDVAGPWQYTHAGAHQAWQAAVNALFGGLPRLRPDRAPMPAVTYTEPEVARVGLNERQARIEGVAFAVTRYDLDELDRAIVEDAREGFVKVLTAPRGDRILGATIVAPRAGEMLSEFTLAMSAGLGLKRLFGPIRPYPAWTEANRNAAAAWRQAHAPRWALGLLARVHAWRRG
jgi:pyruvate/2-oxoglutarate dehydrogenase complex dihydrolipoamide dehydrogenase (E3) component